MPLTTELLLIKTSGNNEITDITPNIETFVDKYNLKNALINVCVAGSTAAIISMEYEPGLNEDLQRLSEKLIPQISEYRHDKKWDDDNAYAHLRATLFGNSKTFAVQNGEIQTGMWQQIVMIDFDNKPRVRKVILQAIE